MGTPLLSTIAPKRRFSASGNVPASTVVRRAAGRDTVRVAEVPSSKISVTLAVPPVVWPVLAIAM